jgi:hypothetical protein
MFGLGDAHALDYFALIRAKEMGKYLEWLVCLNLYAKLGRFWLSAHWH